MSLKQLSLTTRDLQLLAELGELGVMSAPMLLVRHFGGFTNDESAQRSFRRRMKRFVAHGLVLQERLPAAGKLVTVLRLTEAGADWLAELTGSRPVRPAGPQALNPVTLPHRLGVVATRLAFDDACRQAGIDLPEWRFEHDPLPDAEPTAGNNEKFLLYESFQDAGSRLVCWADAAFRLRIAGPNAHEFLAYIEYDRSTENKRRLAAKSAPFQRLVRERRYAMHWPGLAIQHTVRVLFVVRSEQRLSHAIDAIRDTPGAPLFRFATYADVTPERVLSAPIWRTIDWQRLAILKSTPS
ncbi:MAG: replication-relaxation family protein [Pirellulales bacterium]